MATSRRSRWICIRNMVCPPQAVLFLTIVVINTSKGPVVRLSPNHYSLNDLEAFNVIYAHGTNYPKSDFYDPFGPPVEGHATYFSEKDLKLHGQKRKKVSSLFSLSNLLSYEAFVDSNGEKLFEKFAQMAQEKKSISFGDWMQYYAFDVIGSLTVSCIEHHPFQLSY